MQNAVLSLCTNHRTGHYHGHLPSHGQYMSLADERDVTIIAERFVLAKDTLTWEENTHMV